MVSNKTILLLIKGLTYQGAYKTPGGPPN